MLFGMLIPAFGFAALECTPYFFGTVVQISNNNWGIKIDQVSLLDWLRFIWTAIAFIASLVFTLFSYFSAKDKQQRPIRLWMMPEQPHLWIQQRFDRAQFCASSVN